MCKLIRHCVCGKCPTCVAALAIHRKMTDDKCHKVSAVKRRWHGDDVERETSVSLARGRRLAATVKREMGIVLA